MRSWGHNASHTRLRWRGARDALPPRGLPHVGHALWIVRGSGAVATRDIGNQLNGRGGPATSGTWVDEAILRESCFVLITTRPSTGAGSCSDEELFRTYQEQNLVETAIRIFKNPQAVAPLFLKTDARIGALGLVYVLALMVYALIQREVRRLLEKRKADFPGNKGWTQQPTTEVIFRLFDGINTLRIEGHDGVTITNMTTAQHDALQLLDHPLLKAPRVAFTQLKKPKPRHRGWRAVKKAKPAGSAE